MKKLAVTLCLSAVAIGAFAQGTVNFQNGVGLNISTNATAIGGGSGIISGAAGGPYYFALLTASSTITSVDANLQDLLGPTWSFGIHGTNTGVAGRMSGGTGVSVPNWLPGQTNSYIVVGWSASLGASWNAITPLIDSIASRDANSFRVLGAGGGFLGVSAVGFGTAGGPTVPLPTLPFNIYGTTATASGTPVSGFSLLSVIAVPEPSSFALMGLGAAALVIFRRRKQ